METARNKTGKAGAAGALLALAAGASYGVGGAVSQIVKSQGIEIGWMIVAQSVAALIVLGVLVLACKRFRLAMPRKEAVKLVVLGMTSVFSSVGYYIAIDLISVGAAVALQFQYVWMAVVFQCIFERTAPGKTTVISALMIVAGAVMASGMAEELAAGSLQMDPVGIFFALLCAVFYALFIYMNGRVATEHHPVPRTFFLVVGAVIFTFAVLPLMNAGPLPDLGVAVPWGFVMGAIMVVAPCLCIVAASSRLPGGIVAILTSSELPVAVLAGCLMLGESVTPVSIIGVVMIIAAIVLSESGSLFAKKRSR